LNGLILRIPVADHPVLVEEECQGNSGDSQQVQGVHQDGPADPLPLEKEAAPVRVLLLDDSQNLQLPAPVELESSFVPPWHVAPAANSPGGEDEEQGLLSPEGGKAGELALLQVRKPEIGEKLPNPISGFTRRKVSHAECGQTGNRKESSFHSTGPPNHQEKF
jgi:hypothetical protein